MAPPNAQQPNTQQANPNATKVTYAGHRREAEKNGGFFGVFDDCPR
ncbi:hypothetical protein [Saccharothrix variisporea]|uniref:Uncharacterized protein n=1 Tax=Saccharothrix variisporea TaxID=543527 RepID=A0A495XGD6_9PSEU|nr:hypothetical protein [Saccharothrix variisporea]RKT71864.1 hypothetical protein DFJ66_5161 [Saccharothrix variisporea]